MKNPRYEVKSGKYGMYFFDIHRTRDMPLKSVLNLLNRLTDLVPTFDEQSEQLTSLKAILATTADGKHLRRGMEVWEAVGVQPEWRVVYLWNDCFVQTPNGHLMEQSSLYSTREAALDSIMKRAGDNHASD